MRIVWISACLVGFFLFLPCFTAFGQTEEARLFWENPENLVEYRARFMKADSNGRTMVVVWQEYIEKKEDSGKISLSLQVTEDGRNWKISRNFAGPFEYTGNEVPLFSLAMSESGIIYVAVLAGEKSVHIYRSVDSGSSIQLASSIEMDATTIAPYIYSRADGGLVLFVTQDRAESQLSQVGDTDAAGEATLFRVAASALFYSRSDEGTEWSGFFPFVKDPELSKRIHFSPHMASTGEKEYVVFVALLEDASGDYTYQIYSKTSEDRGKTWTVSDLTTSFNEAVGGSVRTAREFTNMRPFVGDVGDTLAVVWERSVGYGEKQIYYLALDDDGKKFGTAENVSQSVRAASSPQLFEHNGRVFVLWFQYVAGTEHIYLAEKDGVVWESIDLSEKVPGSSQFGTAVSLGSELYVLWENRRGTDSNVMVLKPDKTISTPRITTIGFENAGRYKRDDFVITWTEPSDSSGIRGYSVSWDREENGQAPKEISVPVEKRRADITLSEDGNWYIHVAAQDRAGNWSDTVTASLFRDTTPPGYVEFEEPDVDDRGYLAANTNTIKWNAPEGDDIAGYTYSFQFLDFLEGSRMLVGYNIRNPYISTVIPEFSFRNRDNGLWACSVAAVDTVGNIGPYETLYMLMDKYVPETYITSVAYTRDELGRIEMSIAGRGFSEGGNVDRIVLDRDRRLPYDYVYRESLDAYRVSNDRFITDLVLEGLDEGDYWVGVIHPERNLHYSPKTVAIEAMGKVKFGDFRSLGPLKLTVMRGGRITVSFSAIVIMIAFAIVVFLVLFSSQRIALIAREGRMLQMEVRALLTGELRIGEKEERLKSMLRKGMGLRLKFSFFTIVLVISTVLIVAFPLGITMTSTQERILAEGLEEKAEVLLTAITEGARTYLPGEDLLQLGLLQRQTGGVEAVTYVTVTGEVKGKSVEGYEYVWASNDPDISQKLDPEVQIQLGRDEAADEDKLLLGESKLIDSISPAVAQLAEEIDTAASLRIPGLSESLAEVNARGLALSRKPVLTNEEDAALTEIEKESINIRQLIITQLAEVGGDVRSEPVYDSSNLDRLNTSYTFYKPIIFTSSNDTKYFRGLVRIGITTEGILAQIERERRVVLITTGIIALVAIGIGIISALVFTTIIIIPVRRLVAGVEVIRDTEDKEELRDHVINIKTRDELRVLADTVNQMTQGLAAAASASKDLTLGKDTQKMFTPLEQDPSSGRKLTTAYEENKNVEFFGYYEGAKGVSGDYFDYTKLDDKHYAIIKCDVAGKGVPASLIMVEVATIFLDYFRNWSMKSEGIHLERLAYRINDLVEARGFKGRFAALTVIILNMETGATYVCNAGDKWLHMYDAGAGKVVQKELPESPATGVFPSSMVEMGVGFQQISMKMNKGDSLLLFTDGVEEDKRHFLDSSFAPTICAEQGLNEGDQHETHMFGEESEEFSIPRIHDVVNAVMRRERYSLIKYHNPVAGEDLTFDFSGCAGTVREAVLAMSSIDKIFRIIPDPSATRSDRIKVDVKIDEFLKQHFTRYDDYFKVPILDERTPEYIYFGNMKEEDQYDDLTILGIRKL